MRQNTPAHDSRGESKRTRPPGRPRSEQARLAVLSSTLRLLEKNGFPNLTIEHVAADAEVGKATVYRWWPNKAALAADAFASGTSRKLHFPDTGSVRADMNQQMHQVVKLFRSRHGRIVAAIVGGGQSDPDLIAAFRKRFLRPRRREAYATLRRGVQRGELPGDLDMDLVLDALYGPIYMRFLIRHDNLTPGFIDHLCELVFEGACGKRKTAPHKSNGRFHSPEVIVESSAHG
jgi:AcrR family transcriptional regulator